MKKTQRLAWVASGVLGVAAATPAFAADKVVLDYFTWAGGSAVQQIDQYWIKPFEAAHPNVEVNYHYTSFGDFWNKLPTLVASGNAPDLVHMSVAYVYDYAKAGLLLDLQPYFDRDLDPSKYFMEPAAAERFPTTQNGDLYGIPFGFVETGLYYNKDLFDAAGIGLPNDNWTYDDLRTAAKKLTVDVNGDGTPDQYGFDSNLGYTLLDTVIHAFGGATLSDDGTQVLIDQPGAEAGVQFLVDLIWKDHAAPPLNQRGQYKFQSGKLGMTIDLTNSITTFRDQAKFDWNVALLPKGPGGRVMRVWPDSFSIPKEAKHPDLAWDFIKTAINQPHINPYAGQRKIPFLKSLALSSEWLEPSLKPDKMEFVNGVQYGQPLEFRPKWGEWRPLRDAEVQKAFENKESVKTALHNAAELIRGVLKD